MITKINHLGIVVQKADEVVAFLKETFGAQEISQCEYPELKHRSTLVEVGDGCLEIMEPTASDGVVAKFLKKRGGGLHHISLLCDNVETMSQKLEKEGIEVIGKTSEGPFKIAFIHPKSSKGILFELSEKSSLPIE
jgi:methylmalonyl-CoA/ethylmalonyl-CoA epimerase